MFPIQNHGQRLLELQTMERVALRVRFVLSLNELTWKWIVVTYLIKEWWFLTIMRISQWWRLHPNPA